MRRLTLTSTTAALALAIGQTAPLSLAAQTAMQEAQDGTYRTAQADVDETQPTAGDAAQTEAEAAAQAAEAEAQAEAERQAVEAAEAEAQAEAERQAVEAAEAEAQAEAERQADEAAEVEAQAEAERQAVEAAEAEAQAEADAAAQAEADAAQAEAEAAQAEAEQAAEAAADSAEQEAQEPEQALEADQAEAEAEATAATEEPAQPEAEAEAEANAQADEPAEAAENAEAEAAAGTEETADPNTAAQTAEQEAQELEQTLEAEQAEAEPNAGGDEQPAEQAATGQPEPQIDEDPVEQAEAQADAAAELEQQSAEVAAANEEAEAVASDEVTLTEENTRSSDEEFETELGGGAQDAANTETAPAGGTARTSGDRDENLKDILTAAAALGLGAYAIGQVTDDGGTVVSNSGDRVVVERDGRYRIIKDDDALLRRPGSDVRVQTFDDGSTRNTVTAQDGTQTVTIRAADGRVLRRTQIYPDGDQVVLFDDTRQVEAVNVQQLSDTRAREYEYANASEDELRTAILATRDAPATRRYSLNQVRFVDAVRQQVPVIALDTVNFETGSAVIRPEEARDLSVLGNAMRDAIAEDPRQVFLIEGHTDTVGPASNNLALSDRRAESVALALAEYFDVPPANMIVQGYGESDLKIRQAGDIRQNRRAAVRNITGLLNDS